MIYDDIQDYRDEADLRRGDDRPSPDEYDDRPPYVPASAYAVVPVLALVGAEQDVPF